LLPALPRPLSSCPANLISHPQGIIRRGLQVEALREYIIGQGASKNVTYQEWDKIWTINKRIIDPVAPRHTAVVSAGRVPVTITGAPAAVEATEGPKHKKNPAVGTKKILKLNKVGSKVFSLNLFSVCSAPGLWDRSFNVIAGIEKVAKQPVENVCCWEQTARQMRQCMGQDASTDAAAADSHAAAATGAAAGVVGPGGWPGAV
jgi:glutamyl/glutaminyl-tRNA synthetase